MDTTPKYIKMCEGAEEIQKNWRPEEGDWANKGLITLVHIHRPKWSLQILDDSGFPNLYYAKNIVWLPRQDQLQKILDNLMTTPYSMYQALIEWCKDPWGYGSMPFPKQIEKLENWGKYIGLFETAEQLWLAFVMHEKSGKVWLQRETGPGGWLMNFPHGEWIKENEENNL